MKCSKSKYTRLSVGKRRAGGGCRRRDGDGGQLHWWFREPVGLDELSWKKLSGKRQARAVMHPRLAPRYLYHKALNVPPLSFF